MKRHHPGLPLKILLVAFLNVLLLLASFLIFARYQLRLDLGSFLLAPARYRMLSVSRLAALELPNVPRDHWTEWLEQYSSEYPAQLFLFDRDGNQIAGTTVHPPALLFQHRPWHRERATNQPRTTDSPDGFLDACGSSPVSGSRPAACAATNQPRTTDSRSAPKSAEFPLSFGGAESRPVLPPEEEHDFARGRGNSGPSPGPPPRDGRDLPLSFDFEHTSNPSFYWAAVRVPLPNPGQHPIDARLVWRFASLWTNPFFFNYKPWLLTVLVIAVISLACWLPLIRSITHTIAAMTAATGQIAEGRFEVQLPVKRRDELGQLSESINQMAHRLSGYVNGQRRFLGDIAHELCSPVARIQMSLGILEQRTSESTSQYVQTIDEEVQHMSTLISELLSFSKASLASSANLEEVNVSDAVRRAIEREKTEQATINVNVPPLLSVMAQPDYLFRSISNILRNAICYAGADGPIEISARSVGDFAVISVGDLGPGVPAAELEQIVKPFYRPEAARQRETGGIGLGLAIVQKCIEACGGSVTCRNRIPKGFEVDLRLTAAEPRT